MKLLKIASLLAFFLFTPLFPSSNTTWVIFVHGTIGGALAFYHINDIKMDNIPDGCVYAREVERYRLKILNGKDHLLLEYGLIPLPHTLKEDFLHKNFTPVLREYGAYVIVGAFDTLAQQAATFGSEQVRYFTFGWNGLLSQSHRRMAGFNLYNAICDMRDASGENPTIIIIGYSHGGNVALWFEQAEHAYKRNLVVDTLLMLACPMQVETVYATTSPVFKHIYAIRSDGDRIPQADKISTATGKSSARLHDFINPAEINVVGSHHICDIRVLVNGAIKSIDHRSFFNLCYKKRILPELSGMPFLMFVPYLLPTLHQHPEWADIDLHLNVDAGTQLLQLAWSRYGHPAIESLSNNFYTPFNEVRAITDYYWAMRLVKSSDEVPAALDNMLLLPTLLHAPANNLIDRLRGTA